MEGGGTHGYASGTRGAAAPSALERQMAVPNAVLKLSQAGFVQVLDDFDRGFLVGAGEPMNAGQMAFMIRHTTGIVSVVVEAARLEKLGLSTATRIGAGQNSILHDVSIDYLPNDLPAEALSRLAPSASARGRVDTLHALCRDESEAADFSKPGHIFPLCPHSGGVLEHGGGPAEAAYDLCRLAGLCPVAALGELMRDDGELMHLTDCVEVYRKLNVPYVTVEELRQWIRQHGLERIEHPSNTAKVLGPGFQRLQTPGSLDETRSEAYAASSCTIPVRCNNFGRMRLQMFQLEDPTPIEVVACIKGECENKDDVPIRIHSECFTGDVLRSAKCDCGLQLEKFFRIMEREPAAVLLYVRGHEGRGIGLSAKFDAYRLQEEQHLDTVDSNLRLGFEPDLRSYTGIASVIKTLGIKSVRIFTNNPDKIAAVKSVVQIKHEPLKTRALAGNHDYLRTKEERMEHLPTMEDCPMEEQLEELNEDALDPHPSTTRERVRSEERIEWPRFGNYAGFHILIVNTAWNKECSIEVILGCEAFLLEAKCQVTIMEVPGAMDLVAGCRASVARDPAPQAVVAVGTYVRGETDSSRVQYEATLKGLQELNVTSSVPIISGVVFYNTQEDALKRNSRLLGGTWAKNALQMVSVCGP
jgi:GTP cyclohydrolase II